MIERTIADAGDRQGMLKDRLAAFPAVALVGPRQCGKTTLARSLGGRYYDLEQPDDRLRLDLEWTGVTTADELVILDEVQADPGVLPRLRGAIDTDRKRNGRFLLLGSVAPSLMMWASESLAGRLSLVELTPLSFGELDPAAHQRLWLCGGYPDGGVLSTSDTRGGGFPRWQHDYLALLAQRDLPAWGLPARPAVTQRLFSMLAASHAGSWNASKTGRNLGLSYHTVNRYVERLESAFLVRMLPAYHTSLRKQLARRPKLYWRDSGLLHSLIGISSMEDLLADRAVGASWEGHVIEQVLTALQQADHRFEAWHFRTTAGQELDLVVRVASHLWAIEIKLTTQPSRSHLARLNEAADLIGCDHRFLVTRQPGCHTSGAQTVCDLASIVNHAQDFDL